jgi:uncharacterized integral membrane protein
MTPTDVPEATPEASRPVEVASPIEAPADRRGRHRRRARLYLGSAALVALIAVLVVLSSANTRHVKLSWAVGSTDVSLAWVVLAAGVGGWLLGVMTVIVLRFRTRAPR